MTLQPDTPEGRRRPIALRSAAWVKGCANFLAQRGIRPNQISIASVVFAVIGTMLFVTASLSTVGGALWLYMISIVCIYARLACNMLDGMVAIEGGLKSPSGELYNEVPDRLADSFFLIGAGVATASTYGIAIGVVAALGAMLTAYIRAIGTILGKPPDFSGPMAKPHRMHTLGATILAAAIGVPWGQDQLIILIGLSAISVLTWVTVWRRFKNAQKPV